MRNRGEGARPGARPGDAAARARRDGCGLGCCSRALVTTSHVLATCVTFFGGLERRGKRHVLFEPIARAPTNYADVKEAKPNSRPIRVAGRGSNLPCQPP